METPDLENKGLGDGAPGIAPELPAQEAGPARSKAGRKSFEEELRRHLDQNGLTIGPVSNGGPASALEVVPAVQIDDDSNRVGIAWTVKGIEAVMVSTVAGKAEIILGDKDKARQWAEKAKIDAESREVLVETGVKTCAKHGINVGPETPLVITAGQIIWGWKGLIDDLNRLAASKPQPPAA